jgi:nitrite reductase/ring-hydroxylating ferredoxin subunit
MNAIKEVTTQTKVRKDFVPVDAYISKDIVKLEKDRLWPKVWQVACREEAIPNEGSFYTYDIADDSIVVVRTGTGTIKAYHNVCPHRGRRLTDGGGQVSKFFCRFHGWQWTLEGEAAEIVDRVDWGNCLSDADVTLAPVRAETWGGWVWINMDSEAESLSEYLEPAKSILDPYELEKMRYRWHRQVRVPCNWKVALEAFNEAYHVQTTHRQLLKLMDDMTYSKAYGKHGMFGYAPEILFGNASARLGKQEVDIRKGLHDFFLCMAETLRASVTPEQTAAAARLMELPKDSPPAKIYEAFGAFYFEELQKSGRPTPAVTAEQVAAVGVDWHLFPNLVILPQPTNVLGYRARPDGDDPDQCIFEIFFLERFPIGQEPEVQLTVEDDWRTADLGLILSQDFKNMADVQLGMKSRGFRGARTNPVQERAISNFHETLYKYLDAE